MSADVQPVWAVKDSSGVAFYLDAELTKVLKRWERWRADCPSTAQRWHHINRRAYKIIWRRF